MKRNKIDLTACPCHQLNAGRMRAKFFTLPDGGILIAHDIEGGIPSSRDPDYWIQKAERNHARRIWRNLLKAGYTRTTQPQIKTPA